MMPPLKTLKDLCDFIRVNQYPEELILSCEDFNRINDKLNPDARAKNPGILMLGVTRIRAKFGPSLDVSDQRLFE